jgi:Clp amino terminal domain, pathogenicity island component
MGVDAAILRRALGARDRVLDIQHELDRARADYEDLIRRLVAAGGTTREVGAALGISHQRVHQIVDAAPVTPPAPGDHAGLLARSRPRRRVDRAFSRFDDASRELLGRGQEEAIALGHNALGSEHALLALAGAERPGGAVLRALGLGPDEVREAIVRIVGEGPRPVEGRRRACVDPGAMPLTPRFKRVLQAATGVTPPGQPIRPEHLLIAVARVPETVGARILSEHQVDEDAIVNAFIRLDGGDA